MEDTPPSAGDPVCGVGRPPTAAYKETKAQQRATGVGGVHSTVCSPGTTQTWAREGTLLCSRNRRAEDQGIAMLLTTPNTIRTLQRKLYAKAKQDIVRCYALAVRARRHDLLNRANKRGTRSCACLGVKNIGKPCAGKPHARFDEGGQARACSLLYPLGYRPDRSQ